MDNKRNVLLLSGGGGSEHEISQISAKHILASLQSIYNLIHIELTKNGEYIDLLSNQKCTFYSNGDLFIGEKQLLYNFVIPCFHGYPGETGEIGALFDMAKIKYLGQKCEQSVICFNKITTKLWLSALGIPNTPYIIAKNPTDLAKAKEKFKEWKKCFVKASNQGSSVGCYMVNDIKQLESSIVDAFNYSEFVLIEKAIKGRELEVAVYEYEGKIIASNPGEIIVPENDFYSYTEKYSSHSKTKTVITAKDLSEEVIASLKEMSIKAFEGIKLRHLSRVDFFYTSSGEIYLNEINTFPGLTPISMFPKMMEATGHSFTKFLTDIINAN